jgi:hypothetical protein
MTKLVLGLNEEACYPEVKGELKKLEIVSGRYTKGISNEGKLRARS